MIHLEFYAGIGGQGLALDFALEIIRTMESNKETMRLDEAKQNNEEQNERKEQNNNKQNEMNPKRLDEAKQNNEEQNERKEQNNNKQNERKEQQNEKEKKNREAKAMGKEVCVSTFAVDNNEHAKCVYQRNRTGIYVQKNIEHLKVDNIRSWVKKSKIICGQDPLLVFTLSPPCQPFTKGGKGLGLNDKRSLSFVYLVNEVFSKLRLEELPDYVLVENVPEYHGQGSEFFIKWLLERNYSIREYLLCPSQLQIPNQRIRYFMVAIKSIVGKRYPIQNKFPEEAVKMYHTSVGKKIKDILEKSDSEFWKVCEQLHGYKFGICSETSTSSECFTKGYGVEHRYVRGSGSILTENIQLFSSLLPKYGLKHNMLFCDQPDILKQLKVRKFTVREIARLLGFPDDFTFDCVSESQAYSLLGNSISIPCVSVLWLSVFHEIYPLIKSNTFLKYKSQFA